MKTVFLLLSSDQFSYPLLQFLAEEGKANGWKVIVGSLFDYNIIERIQKEDFSRELSFVNIRQFKQCDKVIQKADLVIAIVPDVTLLRLVDRCILYGKSLITPSRLNRQLALRKTQAEESNSLILAECGFSPGLDHITAKKAIDSIHAKGGKISSFKTYSGSLMDDSSAANPWRFKLSEPVVELINMGKHNNRHFINGHLQHIPYHHLFKRSESVNIHGLNDTKMIPEGDSLQYRQLYQLKEAQTVLKGRIFKEGFERIWNNIITLGLTNNTSRVDMLGEKTFNNFLQSLLPYSFPGSAEERLKKYLNANDDDILKLKWLGLLDSTWMERNPRELTCAVVLKYLMERKLYLQPGDRDYVVMQHRLKYEHQNAKHTFMATLLVDGEGTQYSASAKVMGYILGAATNAFLRGSLTARGVCIPIHKNIYDPILNELDDYGVAFRVEEKRIWNVDVA